MIDILDEERIICEAHKFSVERDQPCTAYLNAKCKDEKKIKRSNNRVEEILLEEYEEKLG